MQSGQELLKAREDVKTRLLREIDRISTNGIEYAEKTREYRKIYATTILALKEKGAPATLIKEIAKGDADVAHAEFEMMVAEVKYAAAKENVMATKKLLDSIEEDIKREYYSKGGGA